METIIGEVLGGIFVIIAAYVAEKLNTYFKTKTAGLNDEKLKTVITNLAKAAEQLYKVDDPTGEIRKKYVEERIVKLGYTLTDYVHSLIESCVYDINKENSNDYYDDDWTDLV